MGLVPVLMVVREIGATASSVKGRATTQATKSPRDLRSELLGNSNRSVPGGGGGVGGDGEGPAVCQCRQRGRALRAPLLMTLHLLLAIFHRESAKNCKFRPVATAEARAAEHFLPHPVKHLGEHSRGPAYRQLTSCKDALVCSEYASNGITFPYCMQAL